MKAFAKVMAFLLAAMLLLSCGAAIAESMAEPIVLKGFEDSGEYQYIEMGYYPYTSTGSEQPILWRVLSVSGDVALIRSEYAIDFYRGNKYSDVNEMLSELCERTLGTYLERGAVLTKSIPSETDLNSSYYGYARERLNDMRIVQATPYTASSGALTENGNAAYWTYNGGRVSYVTPNGGIIPVKHTMSLGVVPMLTISIDRLRLDAGSGTKDDPYRSTHGERNLWFERNMKIYFCELEEHINNPYRKRIDVYTGPGEEYYLPECASINKHQTKIKVLAREGSYVMIEYMTTRAGNENYSYHYKTGWVYEPFVLTHNSEWVYNGRRWQWRHHREMQADYSDAFPVNPIDVYVTMNTELHDDRNLKNQPLYVFEEGTEVKLLGYVEHNNIMLGYVEAEIYDQKARGFVRLEDLQTEDEDIGFLTIR